MYLCITFLFTSNIQILLLSVLQPIWYTQMRPATGTKVSNIYVQVDELKLPSGYMILLSLYIIPLKYFT